MEKIPAYVEPEKPNEKKHDLRIEALKRKKLNIDTNNQNNNKDYAQIRLAPIQNLLEKRDTSISDLKSYWESKKSTDEKQLAYVAIEVLGILVTSVSSERSFLKGRYIINDYRTRISSEHAREQMIIKCKREFFIEVSKRINLFENNE